MADSNSPTQRTTSAAKYNDVIKEIARRNDEGQKAGRKRRAIREREQLAARRQWERL